MKKILLALSVVLLLSGCYKDDINDLKNDVNDLKSRMAQYENLLDVLNKRLYVVNYETKDGSYVITMSDGSKLNVRNTSSFIKIGENGNWWIDGVDTGKSAKGESGAKGEAAKITIGANGNWFVDAVDTGVSASGQKGKDAAEITSVALANGIMTFTFADGRTISIVASAPEITLPNPAGGFAVDKMQWFKVQPQLTNAANATSKWIVNSQEVAATTDLFYIFSAAGTYNIEFKAKNGVGESSKSFTVTVAEKAYLNKITRVFDFFPAPGQFVNALPAATATDTDETMRVKAETALTAGNMISLGGFGGYVQFGFDHTIINKEGNDFVVLGNAFNDWAEPGIVMVSYDANGNGKADDEWFEIAGSEHNKATTIKNYEMTYYKPEAEPTNPNEPNYIRWTDNQGQTGYIAKNQFHKQTFFPLWKGNTVTFKGTFLKSNIYDKSGGKGNNWANPAYEWGYTDNWANADVRGQIDISWAVNAKGESVKLKGVDFIKVYNSNRAEGGWLGEVSTEVSGFKDLNLP
ncbi:PL29 family lyase N-terminal domain-containing protein [Flavobacterium plurextorum]|uniref:PKD-like domain-containing protein n=1 Tax=Flavobacterium TaxID=237 RepID=UPI00214D903E|nr:MULTISPECIES: PKD-like domain-containing protein [Flavobacterium]UUW11039.1 PL29 family lyase N-terminal domain-containing protein [Flavobacterium plurextorum]